MRRLVLAIQSDPFNASRLNTIELPGSATGGCAGQHWRSLAELLCFTVAGQQFTGPAGEIVSPRDAIRRVAVELLPVLRNLQAEGKAPGARSGRFLIEAIEGTGP
jgi:hypothetical protein